MLGKLARRNRRWFPAAAIAALAAAIMLAAAPAALAISPANPPNHNLIATCDINCTSAAPIYYIGDSNYGIIFHKCSTLGIDSAGTQAVECIDLYAQPDDGTNLVDVYPYVEAYCQNSSGYVKCREVYINAELGQGTTTPTQAWAHCQTNTTTPCSATGRNYGTVGDTYVAVNGAAGNCTEVGTLSEVWAVAEVGSWILTNNGVQELATANLGTSHALICSG
jgi:hypothetical protein